MEKKEFLTSIESKCLESGRSKKKDRLHLCGVHFKNGSLYTTDGHKMCKIEGVQYPEMFEGKVVMNSLKTGSEEDISFEVINELMFVVRKKVGEEESVKELVRTIDLDFPDCERVIPEIVDGSVPNSNTIGIDPRLLPPLRTLHITISDKELSPILVTSPVSVPSMTWILMPLRK